MPVETWINPEAEPDAKGDHTKVVKWAQTAENLNDKSGDNPYDDARAHRGAIRGDFVIMGYTWTPNWASARNAHDKYDFHIRRSFDGGQTWTTDPDGSGITHVDTFKVYTEGETESEEDDNRREKYEVITSYGPGEFEPALNISRLPNNKETVIEPRIVGTPSTIKGSDFTEDQQNPDVFYMTYGTATNVPDPHGPRDDDEVAVESSVPCDIFYTFTKNRGETFVDTTWEVLGDPQGEDAPETGEIVTGWDWLAKNYPEQGEAQIRMTPDGSRFYATWLQESEPEDTNDGISIDQGDGIGSADGSDIWFRRIMPSEFDVNVAKVVGGTTVDEDDATPLAGVEVQLHNATEGTTHSTVTNEDGNFKFDALSEGEYTVSVDEGLFENPEVSVVLDAETPKVQVRFKKGSSSLKGDFDGDGDLDFDDYNIFIASFGRCEGQEEYNPACNFDEDTCITFVDYQIWYGYYVNAPPLN